MARGTTASISFSDIPVLDRITQNVGLVAGRNLLIDILRECFSRDREYRWLGDSWGFNKTPSHLNLDPDAGIIDDDTTRLYIGSTYRYDITYLPAIVVRQTSSSYRPISFNQNRWLLEYEDQQIIDGYGEITFAKVPSKYVYSGMWEQRFDIKITSKSLEDTSTLTDAIMISLQSTYRLILQANGLFIKSVSSGGEQTENYGSKDPLFINTVSVEALSEWRREVLVSNLVERIQFCLSFDMSENDPPSMEVHHIDFELDS